MGRAPPYCSKKQAGLNRGAWTAMEDQTLTHYITIHGEGKWRNIPKNAGLNRCGKSCRLRWLNYLRPDIKRGNITNDEEELIIRLHKLLGNRWALIAGRLPGRTDNEIKNYWNTVIGKKIIDHKSTTPSHRVSQVDQFNSQNQIKRSLSSNFNENIYKSEYIYLDPLIVSEKNKDITDPEDNFLINFEGDRDFLSDILNSTELSRQPSPNSGFLLDETDDILSMGSFLGSDC